MYLVVVVPTYNESENLPSLAAGILKIEMEGLRVDLLVVDDNSPDGTGAVADRLAREYCGRVLVSHRDRKTGYGPACVEGFQRALAEGADMIVQMDADFSHKPDYIPQMIRALPGFDVVVGSRYVRGGQVDPRWPWWRKFLSWWGSTYARGILGIAQRDVTTGFRLYRRHVLETIPFASIRSGGYSFLIEMSYLCQCQGIRTVEVPIVFMDRSLGRSKMSVAIMLEAAIRVWQIGFAARFRRSPVH